MSEKIDDLYEVIEKHHKWLAGEKGGEHADLSHTDLSGMNLQDINFRMMDLCCVDFSMCNLRGCNFSEAILRGANFARARLRGATFSAANMRGVTLSGNSDLEFPLYQVCLSGGSHTRMTLLAEGSSDRWQWIMFMEQGDEEFMRHFIEERFGKGSACMCAMKFLKKVATRNVHQFSGNLIEGKD